MLMSMLSAAVDGLTTLEALVPVARQLGARQVVCGVRAEQYATVGSALLGTLEQGLGDKFTPPVREAWATAYGLLADLMQMGASEAQSQQATMA